MGYPTKGPADFLRVGDWNVSCSLCGKKLKASEAVRNWQGMYRCKTHNEVRQPQDFVRSVSDKQTPPFVQPPSDIDRFVCDLNSISGMPGWAIPGCMLPGRTHINY